MKKISEFFDDRSRFVFVSSVVVMLLAHGFCFMNLMYSHDSLFFNETDISGLLKVGYGRWLYPFLVHNRLLATPWLMGALSIFYVSFAVVLVTKTLNFNKIQGLCAGILFASNITLTSLFCTYIFDADADCLALLLACYTVYSFEKYPKVISIIVPIISLALCLSLYQAYVCVTLGLFLLLLIAKAIPCSTWNEIHAVLIMGLKALTVLMLGTAIYIPLLYATSKFYRVELSTGYNGAGALNSLTIIDCIKAIPAAYGFFIDNFLNITEYNTVSLAIINLLILILLLIAIVIYIYIQRMFLGSLLIVLPCIILFPLSLNIIYLVSFGTIHQLMIFAFCLVYLLPMVMIISIPDLIQLNRMKKILCILSFLAITYIGFNNIVYSNGAYVYKKLVYDNTSLHAQTIWKDINNLEGYNDGNTPVIFVGEFGSSKAAYNSSVDKRYKGILTGATNSSITYSATMDLFYSDILGRRLNIITADDDIETNKEIIEMPVYPQDGYCKMIGENVIVKLRN